MKQKKTTMADSKKLSFSNSPILKKKILREFCRLVVGLVELIDAKGNDVAVGRKIKYRQKITAIVSHLYEGALGICGESGKYKIF